jgi:cytoskeletal protein RodZ
MAQQTGVRNVGWLKALVIVMGVVIAVGFIVVFVELGRRIVRPSPSEPPQAGAPSAPGSPTAKSRGFGEVNVPIPRGAKVESVASADGRAVALVRLGDGGAALYVIDPATGALLGIVRLHEDKR